MNLTAINREPIYYATGYKGSNHSKAPFYLRALVFDKKTGRLTRHLIDEFNRRIRHKFKNHSLLTGPLKFFPKQIIIINASSDNLPTSYETARIFKYRCNMEKWDVEYIKVVNSKQELVQSAEKFPDKTLVVSQCVNKKVYDINLAKNFYKRNIVVVPGELTAPGSIFSDKDKTYKLLSNDGKKWDMVARYKKIDVEGKGVEEVVEEILGIVDKFFSQFNKNQFFIKPVEGGGGLGGFRLIKSDTGYIIPDLSKVTGETGNINLAYININLDNEAKLKELLWIYNLFKSDKRLSGNYIKIDIEGKNEEEQLNNLRKYLNKVRKKRSKILQQLQSTRKETKRLLISAIEKYEQKFGYRYIPLVNEHIDFGTWGLRAHFRLSKEGPKLETIYTRIFQLAFTPEGVGYVGSDNISNKQTGELEIKRLCPINQVMLDAIGGKEALFEVLFKGVKTLIALISLQLKRERYRIPFRLQLDLAAISKLIGEVNADTARGLCLASPWGFFVKNASEWMEDSLRYYSWSKETHTYEADG